MGEARWEVPGRRWGPLTLEDLDEAPEDGRRYELVDGSLHVSPPPVPRHQLAATRVQYLLHAAAPAELTVLAGGAGILAARPRGETHFLVPDVLVVGTAALGAAERGLDPRDVRLVVEVVSPSSVTHDHVTKRDAYAALGVPHYWILEHVPVPRVTVLELAGSAYREQAVLGAGDELRLTRPFPLILRPADLLS